MSADPMARATAVHTSRPLSGPVPSPGPVPALDSVPPPGPDTAPPTTPARPSAAQHRAPLLVLRYGSVRSAAADAAAPEPYRGAVSTRRLDEQLRWLRGRGLRGVAMSELLRAHAAGRATGLVGLTFDDGYADFLSAAVPILRRYECTATVFVIPGLLGGLSSWETRYGPSRLLSAREIAEVAGAGMEIGSRGLFHMPLRAVGQRLLVEEVAGSRERLARITGQPPAGFSYPYGQLDGEAINAVRAAGYRYACAVDPGALTGQYALPRTPVAERDTPWRLAVKRRLHSVLRRPVPAVALPPPTADGPAAAAPPPGDAAT